MARTVKNTKSPEQRKAEAEALQATISEQVEALRDSDAWERYLRFARSFHRYSLGNLLLILGQCPEATQVAGYRKWQSMNRQVMKGQKGIRIFGGREVKEAEEDQARGDENQKRRVVFFPVSVFDQGQTQLIDETEGDPSEIAHRITGDDDAGIYAATVDYLSGQGWTVEREAIPGSANGYTTADGSRRVVVDADLTPAHAAKTALHEAAHVLLHADLDRAEYMAHRGIAETEAESVAYVVAGVLGLETSAYTIGYVAEWSTGDVALIKETAARVLKAAHTLTEAIASPEPATVGT